MTSEHAGPLPTFPFDTVPGLDRVPEAERLLAQASVVRARSGDREVWLALGYRAVRQVLSDPRFSREAATRAGGPETIRSAADPELLTSMDPPRHHHVRRLMSGAFSPRQLQRLEPRIQGIVDELQDRFEPPADFVRGLAEPLPVLVICELLGVPVEDRDRDRIRAWAERLIARTAYPPEEIDDAVRQVRAYLNDLIHARRERPDDALISALVGLNDAEGHLSDSELTTNLQLLLMAGHETTVNQLGNSLITLFQHPEQIEALRLDPGLWPGAIEELLRHSMLTPSSLPRVTTEEADLDGTLIGAGEAVIPLTGVANRDPAAFTDPHRFDIRRTGPAPHLALGHGPHYCLGAHLTKLELRIALESVLKRFPTLTPAVEPSDIQWKEGLAVRTAKALPVTW
ncbi:cytochrome P450 [Streptomyces sp. NPDC000410]|uniref:cytochrome P450 n=1 Tax=Streptomyces sp. NPDC000410 TaxID=3154254 RepID=UPI0033338B0F